MKRLLLSLAIALGLGALSANADTSRGDPTSFSSGQHHKPGNHKANTTERQAHSAIKRTRKARTKTVTNVRNRGKAATRRASAKSAAKTRTATRKAGTRQAGIKSAAKTRTANRKAGTRRASAKSPGNYGAAKGGAYAARRARLLPAVKSATPSHIPVDLVDAIISKESSYDATARGSHGEIGLMQLLPSTARQIARKLGRGSVAGFSDAKLRSYLSVPSNNLKFGLDYLSTCHKMAKGNIAATVGCYNAGPGNMWRWGKIELTRAYVKFVRTHMANEG